MPAGVASALAVVRVERGQPRPAQEVFREAIERDRGRLHLPARNHLRDLTIAGPYAITIDGRELDEYVVWEQ